MTGEYLSPDVLALLKLFHDRRVRYVIIGGEAVIYHGYPRLTGDIDLFYDADRSNANRLFAALEEFWQGDVPAVNGPEDLAHPDLVVQFGRPPNRVDLISGVGPVTFANAWRGRLKEPAVTPEGEEFVVYYVGLRELLAMKRGAGRHKDLDDVEHLRAVNQPSRRPPAPKKTLARRKKR